MSGTTDVMVGGESHTKLPPYFVRSGQVMNSELKVYHRGRDEVTGSTMVVRHLTVVIPCSSVLSLMYCNLRRIDSQCNSVGLSLRRSRDISRSVLFVSDTD